MKTPTLFKKICLLSLLILISSTAAYSQALIALLFGKKLSTDKVQLGLFLAAQNSMLYGTDEKFWNVDFSIGAYTDIKLGHTQKWMISNYMVFKSPKGGRGLSAKDNTFFDLSNVNDLPAEIQDLTDVTINRNLTYFEITPLMRYNITPSWAVGLGPCFGILTVAKDTYKSDKEDADGNKVGLWEYTTKVKSNINWYDVGIAADLQFRLLQGKGLNFNIRYAQGLTEVYKNTDKKVLNAYFHVGIGIPIGGQQKSNAAKNEAKAQE